MLVATVPTENVIPYWACSVTASNRLATVPTAGVFPNWACPVTA